MNENFKAPQAVIPDSLVAVRLALANPFDRAVRVRRRTLGDLAPPRLGEPPKFWVEWSSRLDLQGPEMELAHLAVLLGTLGSELPRSQEVPSIKELSRRFKSANGIPLEPSAASLAVRAVRVHQALEALIGDTEVISKIRKEAWSAAFGRSLDLSIGLDPLIRTTPVLISGATGTGKELVGQALGKSRSGHFDASGKWIEGQFEAVHLSALPDTLIPAALFGNEAGAYTDAREAQDGVLERCHGGAVLLDEVAELPMRAQVTLLRVLQEGRGRRLGGSKDIDMAPRLISATHRDLEALCAGGSFRNDLLQRLAAVRIFMPPLKERRSDIPKLAEKEIETVDIGLRGQLRDEVSSFLEGEARDYSWPGNVRELSAVVRAIALGIPPRLATPPSERDDGGSVPLKLLRGQMTVPEVLTWYARRVRSACSSQNAAAERLGIHRGTLKKYLQGPSTEKEQDR